MSDEGKGARAKQNSKSNSKKSRLEGEMHSSSEDENEFWDNDPHLKARCILSKGRLVYRNPAVLRNSVLSKNSSKEEEERLRRSPTRRDQMGKDQDDAEPPKEYEIFLDIKKSYETSLARMDILVKKLQAENIAEKTKRIKFQKIAEDI